jgi:hypothetical protein
MNTQDMTLGDFVQQLLLKLRDRELTFRHERPWHELFYSLKAATDKPGKPRFFQELFFDWNGEYPKCQELSDYLHALHWTGCMTAANPTYDRFKLNDKIGHLWEKEVDKPLRDYLEEAAGAARHDLAV